MSTFKDRAGEYLRAGPGGVNFEKLAVYGGLLIAAYLIFKTYKVGKAVTDAVGAGVDAARTGVTNTLEWLKPFDIGDMLFFTAQFPDGSKHSIGSRAVASDGTFTVPTVLKQGGTQYFAVQDIPGLRGKWRLKIDRSIVKGVNKFAVRV